jgi:hypothetical protein
MKIAFCGDSYCADPHKGTWLALVLEEYNAEMVCKGRGGTALFHAYEDLLGIIDEVDYIILCITDAFRIPNRFGIPIDAKWLSIISWNFKKLLGTSPPEGHAYHNGREVLGKHHEKAVMAGKLYYNEIMSFEFHKVAQKGILMQMDELMLQKKKKCIWFPCFDNEMSMQSYIPKSGPIASHHLNLISKAEFGGNLKESARVKRLVEETGNDGRFNHLNVRNNRNMAKLIMDIIRSNNFKPREIDMNSYFKGLENV